MSTITYFSVPKMSQKIVQIIWFIIKETEIYVFNIFKKWDSNKTSVSFSFNYYWTVLYCNAPSIKVIFHEMTPFESISPGRPVKKEILRLYNLFTVDHCVHIEALKARKVWIISTYMYILFCFSKVHKYFILYLFFLGQYVPWIIRTLLPISRWMQGSIC